jgi:HPt (histidine-containing phosphotransfer) domain-containing protein
MSSNLPLLNYDFALNQLGGNESLLSKMLGKFSTEFEAVSSELKDLLAAGDTKSAKMRVHTIKGISGNLGLQALYECATEFDAQLREDRFQEETFQRFSSLVQETCVQIHEREQINTPEKSLVSPTLSKETSKLELTKKLERNEFIDDDTLINLVSGLSMSEEKSKELIELIEELQYQDALHLVSTH